MWVYYSAEPMPWWGWVVITGIIAVMAAVAYRLGRGWGSAAFEPKRLDVTGTLPSMGRPNRNRVKYSVYLDKPVLDVLDARAMCAGRPLSDIIRTALAEAAYQPATGLDHIEVVAEK